MLALTGKSFLLDHVYGTAGTYTVTVTVTDSEGDSGSATLTVNVRKFSFQWHEPVEARSRSAGCCRSSSRSSVPTARRCSTPPSAWTCWMRQARCWFRLHPYPTFVKWNGSDYHVNVDTRGFAPGDYTLRVSFSSPTLTGSFTKQGTVTADAFYQSRPATTRDKDKSDKDKSDKDKKEK